MDQRVLAHIFRAFRYHSKVYIATQCSALKQELFIAVPNIAVPLGNNQ